MFWYKLLKADKMINGEILNINTSNFVMKNNILRDVGVYSEKQEQTEQAFGFKWSQRDTYESKAVQEKMMKWLYEKYLDDDLAKLEKYVPDGAKVLDAGCGASMSAVLLLKDKLNKIKYLGADISDAVDVAQERFHERKLTGEFIQADINNLPFVGETFDVIFSEGVLHHTDSTEQSLKYLSKLLIPGGYFMFYVYKLKGPIREFTDDLIRQHIQSLNDEEAWDTLRPLTKLGKTLGDLNIEIDIPEDIPYLGIKAGKIDIQRFFYWNICKSYYRPDWTLEEMNHINFDWFRPMNCQRHTVEEIEKWCMEAGMKIEQINVEEAGITVVACKV